MIQQYKYETMIQQRTHNNYESIYCKNNAGVHDYIKYLKYGYGKVTDHINRDIDLKEFREKMQNKLSMSMSKEYPKT